MSEIHYVVICPDYKELLCSQQNKTITLHNVLSMSTGLKWDEATYDYGDPQNSLSMTGSDPLGYLFTRQRIVNAGVCLQLAESFYNERSAEECNTYG